MMRSKPFSMMISGIGMVLMQTLSENGDFTANAFTLSPSPCISPSSALRPSATSLKIPIGANSLLSCRTFKHSRPAAETWMRMKDDDSSSSDEVTGGGAVVDYSILEPEVYPQRWVQLGYLSLLALLSDWICFAVAAAPKTFESAYAGHSAAGLIDLFLFTNVASCFLVTDVIRKFGLAKAIKGASALMATGCLLRSGLGPLNGMLGQIGIGGGAETAGLVPYSFIIAGTVLVGAAQPFFQCTPPMLSATWFASDERATSTAIALNFNQIGIATAFLVGGGMASDVSGLGSYFGLITVFSLILAAGTFLQFEDRPPSPPSTSEIEKLEKGEEEPPFIDSVKKFFSTKGFTFPLAAFIMSISITNIVGAFIDEVMCRGGVDDQFLVDLAGAGFEFSILLGGIIIGGYVDKTKKYKSITLACITASIFLLIPLGLTEHSLGKEPLLLVLSLLGLGMAAGPIQPINAELAVDVTYPSDETAVESVQQIGGNLVSALLVPIAEMASKSDYQLLPTVPLLASDIRGDVILLMVVATVTLLYFRNFDAPLKRSLADSCDTEDDMLCVPDERLDVDFDGPIFSSLYIEPTDMESPLQKNKVEGEVKENIINPLK